MLENINFPKTYGCSPTLLKYLSNEEYTNADGKILVPFGHTNKRIIFKDITSIPHMLIGGTTGSGKTEFVLSLITSMISQYSPNELKLVLFNSKFVDFACFNRIPHLMLPVVSDRKKISGVAAWLVNEALRRFKEKAINPSIKFPDIFFILDDFSDCYNNDSFEAFSQLTKLGREANIHCIMVTSSPIFKTVPSEMKWNIPCRIAFATASKSDSRIILDENGAETLNVPGEIIFKLYSKLTKCQCLYIPEHERLKIIHNLLNCVEVKYEDEVIYAVDRQASNIGNNKKTFSTFAEESDNKFEDEMLQRAIKVVVETQSASTTLLQRKLKLGYARAASLIDKLEEKGIIGPYEGANPRKVLIKK